MKLNYTLIVLTFCLFLAPLQAQERIKMVWNSLSGQQEVLDEGSVKWRGLTSLEEIKHNQKLKFAENSNGELLQKENSEKWIWKGAFQISFSASEDEYGQSLRSFLIYGQKNSFLNVQSFVPNTQSRSKRIYQFIWGGDLKIPKLVFEQTDFLVTFDSVSRPQIQIFKGVMYSGVDSLNHTGCYIFNQDHWIFKSCDSDIKVISSTKKGALDLNKAPKMAVLLEVESFAHPKYWNISEWFMSCLKSQIKNYDVIERKPLLLDSLNKYLTVKIEDFTWNYKEQTEELKLKIQFDFLRFPSGIQYKNWTFDKTISKTNDVDRTSILNLIPLRFDNQIYQKSVIQNSCKELSQGVQLRWENEFNE